MHGTYSINLAYLRSRVNRHYTTKIIEPFSYIINRFYTRKLMSLQYICLKQSFPCSKVLSNDPGKVDRNFFCYAATVLSPHRNVLIFTQRMHKPT